MIEFNLNTLVKAGRNTVQAKDIVIEGCTMAYLGYNLLNRCTIRLLNKRRYGLIGRNGVGKRYSKIL
jgi:ABC-type bacteriocin/lantibiotic exporter with double-glycine peptidase domain